MAGLIRERDLIIPALLEAADRPGGEISTTQLIEALTDEFQPDGHDALTIEGRNDTYFSQKVRNLISHRGTATSMFTRGYATYDGPSESIRITDLGRKFLDSVPQE